MPTTEAIKGVIVTNADAFPRTPNNKTVTGGVLKAIVETVEVASDAVIGCTYRMARLPSNAALIWFGTKCDAITSATANIGLYRIARDGGAVVDAACYATAKTLNAAITTASPNDAFEARDVANNRRELWQDAGLTSDPGVDYDVTVTLAAAATSAGTLSAIVFYTDGN